MRSDLLHVVGVLNNPMRWRSRLENYRRWEERMLDSGVRLTTVELAYGDQPFELPDRLGVTRVRVRSRWVLWHKENLINVGFSRIPDPDWKYGMWLDTDTFFARHDWAAETVHQLQLHRVVQVASELVKLGPKHEILSHGPSLMKLHYDGLADGHPGNGRRAVTLLGHDPAIGSYYYAPGARPGQVHGWPGGSWAYRRQAFDELGGLLDCCIVGAGDHHMAQALLERPDPLAEPCVATLGYRRRVQIWRDRAREKIKRDVGLVHTTAFHEYHGTHADRRYPDRWKILWRNQYDPDVDVSYDSQGLLQLTENKPALRDDLRMYFALRNEAVNAVV
jgi:hypothetical protein